MTLDRWLAREPSPDVINLVCFPFAGGLASAFNPWTVIAPDWLNVLPVCLPGRARRSSEPAIESVDELADSIVENVMDHLPANSWIFGHSFGGLLGYETARRSRPGGLIASAHRAPHLPGTSSRVRDKTDVELFEMSARMGARTSALLRRPDYAKRFARPFRSDLLAAEGYFYRPKPAFEGALLVLGGLDDPVTPSKSIARWVEVADRGCEIRMLDGGHFFAFENSTESMGEIVRFIENHSATPDSVEQTHSGLGAGEV